jgi:hypothetical protein
MQRRWAAAVLAVGLAAAVSACNDSESVGDALGRDEDSDGDERDETSAGDDEKGEDAGSERLDPDDVPISVPDSGHRFETTPPFDVSGEVQDADHYATRGTLGDTVTEVIVVDGQAFIRDGTVETVGTERYDLVPAEQYESSAVLEDLAELADDGGEVGARDVSDATFNYATELATIDPATFVEIILAGDDVAAETEGEQTSISTDRFVPQLAQELYDEIEGVAPIAAEVVVDDDGVPISGILRADLGAPIRVQVNYEFVELEPIVAPSPELIDPTPYIDEEDLAAFADTPLVAPATPPTGMALRSVLVLSTEQTLEGCPQVQLEYADDTGLDALVIYLLPQDCAEAFDGAPFDETYGGLPSRFSGAEVLHDTTVVQLTGTLQEPEREAVAASLQPTTPDALVAAVVPLPD